VQYDQPTLVIDHLPAADLNIIPGLSTLNEAELAAAGERRPEVPIFLATAACLAHNLLAPAMNYPPSGILLDGEGARCTGAAAALAMGCVDLDLRKRLRGEYVRDRLNDVCCRHDWPVVLNLFAGHPPRVTAQWAESPGPKNAILPLGEYATLSLATNPGFNLISSAEPAAPLGALRGVAQKLIPAYFEDLCKRRLWIDRRTKTHPQDILHDMADWIQRAGGNPRPVIAAQNVLWVGGKKPERLFLELIFRLYDGGHIQMIGEGYRRRKRGVPAIECRLMDILSATNMQRSASEDKQAVVTSPSVSQGEQAVLWVPVLAINRVLGRQGAPAVNLRRILDALQGKEGFLGEAEDGWLFDKVWWAAQYKKRGPGKGLTK
jgi:hypothetical protein